MKIIHLSDPHIEPEILFDIDSSERFKLALNHIKSNHKDADLFIITGDLTHFGKERSYEKFDLILNEFNFPRYLYPKLLMGNHDNRNIFKKKFTNYPTDKNGFIQYFEDRTNNRFVFLDTNQADTDQGHFCNQRQKWLIDILKESDDKSVYLFMHHNPLPLTYLSNDQIGLQQRKEFKSILNNFKKTIKHIFFGHQHITVSGNYLGIPFSSPRSTWSPLVPNFSKKYRLGIANTDPNYNVILIKEDSLVVHSEDFLKTNINWFEN